MTVRKVVTRRGKKFRGRYPSSKNQCHVEWESLHERDAIAFLEFSPLVKAYAAQPSEEIYYTPEGLPHRYYPDLRAWLWDGTVIDIEVKPKKKLCSPALAAKYQLIAQMYAEQGREFRILTEDVYRAGPLKANLKRIQRCKRLARDVDELEARLQRFKDGKCWSLNEATQIAGDIRWVLALVAVGQLFINVQEVFSAESKVWRDDGGDDGAFLF